ncbi:Na+/H+ antiporter [Gluconacetobacter johannae]|uniref:Na+/H+ antiporter n=1 Tax=Gluconacetobacter johannae TaxID=112140 RepID=A0A7W4P2M2_9PROT|nr:Na+/H+ antiporter [Gluconacetobacter johannae]MBB2174929.1 Na+/H+ antiporter [Gluconacetobacter johannae]
MSDVGRFEFILVLVVAIVVLALVARLLRLPTSAALIVGGIALALIPGMPDVDLDPELVLVAFLPPLLLSGAYFTVWPAFRVNLGPILQLAVGTVLFTTLVVGVAAHWLMPSMPWAACFALGAIVAPPDAVAAKSVLERVHLPEKLSVMLEGESLLNDATSLVLYRFAVAAVLTGSFSLLHATLAFGVLAVGGVVLGGACGWIVLHILRRIRDPMLVISLTLLTPWIVYITGERAGVSGVMATVTAGLMIGWHQHEIFGADVRLRATAVWSVLTFMLESLIFILIGLSLRGVLHPRQGVAGSLPHLAWPVAGVVLATIVARFAWMYGATLLEWLLAPDTTRPAPAEAVGRATVLGWAGMRGVVSLAVALSVPATVPGRDFILLATFAVILVTVLGQGATIGLVIRWTGVARQTGPHAAHLTEPQARARLADAQRQTVERLAHAPDGTVLHPRLLEQYRYRARVAARFSNEVDTLRQDRDAHYAVLLATIEAGRAELLRLHRGGMIHDHVLRRLENELDLQQLAAEGARGND